MNLCINCKYVKPNGNNTLMWGCTVPQEGTPSFNYINGKLETVGILTSCVSVRYAHSSDEEQSDCSLYEPQEPKPVSRWSALLKRRTDV